MAETLDTTTSQALIRNYKDALKADAEARRGGGWLNIAGKVAKGAMSGIAAQREEKRLAEEAKKEELQAYEDQYTRNAEAITQNMGSLGPEYYDLAFEEAKVLQDQYAQAVQNGDKKLQGELKMKLNSLSTNVQALKENLSIAADMKSDENGESSLSNGRTEEEKLITATCTDPANIAYDNGEWKWRNPKFDPSVEGSKEFFSQEDLNNSLVLIDEAVSEEYVLYEKSMNESGMAWQYGDEGASNFDEKRITTNNKNFINQENIMSIMHDDFRKIGDDNTFVKQLGGFLENAKYEDLGLDPKSWDKDGDGDVDADDFALEQDKERLYKAITDKTDKNYDFETSRGIIAEWMTSFQKKAFIGDTDPDLVPEPGEDRETFISRGGVMGNLAKNNMKWNSAEQRFEKISNLSKEDLYKKYKEKNK